MRIWILTLLSRAARDSFSSFSADRRMAISELLPRFLVELIGVILGKLLNELGRFDHMAQDQA